MSKTNEVMSVAQLNSLVFKTHKGQEPIPSLLFMAQYQPGMFQNLHSRPAATIYREITSPTKSRSQDELQKLINELRHSVNETNQLVAAHLKLKGTPGFKPAYYPATQALLKEATFPCIQLTSNTEYTFSFEKLAAFRSFKQYQPIHDITMATLRKLYLKWDEMSKETRGHEYSVCIQRIQHFNEQLTAAAKYADKIEKQRYSTDKDLGASGMLILQDIAVLRAHGIVAELPKEVAAPKRSEVKTSYSKHYTHPLDGTRQGTASAKGIHHNIYEPLWAEMEVFDLTPQRTLTAFYREQCIVNSDFQAFQDTSPELDFFVKHDEIANPGAPSIVVLGKHRREITTESQALLDAHIVKYFEDLNSRGKLKTPALIERLIKKMDEVNTELDKVQKSIELWEDYRSLPEDKRSRFAHFFKDTDINILRRKERELDEQIHILEGYEAKYLEQFGNFDFTFTRLPSERELLEEAGFEVMTYADWKDDDDSDGFATFHSEEAEEDVL